MRAAVLSGAREQSDRTTLFLPRVTHHSSDSSGYRRESNPRLNYHPDHWTAAGPISCASTHELRIKWHHHSSPLIKHTGALDCALDTDYIGKRRLPRKPQVWSFTRMNYDTVANKIRRLFDCLSKVIKFTVAEHISGRWPASPSYLLTYLSQRSSPRTGRPTVVM